MKSTQVALVTILLLFSTSELVAQKRLSRADERAIDKALEGFADLDKDEQRSRVMAIAALGKSVDEHLANLVNKDPSRGEVFKALDALHYVRGRDLHMKDMKVEVVPWSRWTFAADEVLLLKGLNRYAGLQVQSGYDPSKGEISVTLVETDDPIRSLGGPGVKKQVLRLTGKEVVIEGAPIRAFPTREYTLKLFGAEVVLRTEGTGAFRYRKDQGAPPVSRTGKKRLKSVKASMAKDQFEGQPDRKIDESCRRVQQYLFRIMDGFDPLPTYGTPDEARFAAAEQVRITARADATNQLVMLVEFPHAEEDIPFTTNTHALLQAFVDQCALDPKPDLLIWRGKSEVHEVNQFWNGTKFVKPDSRLKKRVRDLFPEDY